MYVLEASGTVHCMLYDMSGKKCGAIPNFK